MHTRCSALVAPQSFVKARLAKNGTLSDMHSTAQRRGQQQTGKLPPDCTAAASLSIATEGSTTPHTSVPHSGRTTASCLCRKRKRPSAQQDCPASGDGGCAVMAPWQQMWVARTACFLCPWLSQHFEQLHTKTAASTPYHCRISTHHNHAQLRESADEFERCWRGSDSSAAAKNETAATRWPTPW